MQEHHLQRAICSGTVIPTPEVFDIEDLAYYSELYPPSFKMPRQLIYMQPFSMEADIPDYDMDSEDEAWVTSQASRLELTPDKFEEMMDRLEKGSGQTVVTLQEAKALIKEDDDLIIAVYDYWLNKRLKTQHPLIPQVRTEARHGVTNHNPYIAFRRRTEKMQTRKNRKNDESSYEKMLKLKRDLSRALSLLEMVKKREKSKRELLHLSIEVFEKRYQAGDYSGQIVAEALQQRPARPAFTPIFQPNSLSWIKEDPVLSSLTRKEKRQYKKRRHKSSSKGSAAAVASGSSSLIPGYSSLQGYMDVDAATSEEETALPASPSEEEEEEEAPFAFRRKAGCIYQSPVENGNWPWCTEDETGVGDKRFRFYPTSLRSKSGYNVGFFKTSRGRVGRMVLDRINCRSGEDLWRSFVNESTESNSTAGNLSAIPSNPNNTQAVNTEVSVDVPTETSPYSSPVAIHYRPKTPEIISDSDPMFESFPQTSLEIESTMEDPEEDNILSKLPSLSSENSYIGVMVSGGDSPLVYNAHGLQSDPPLRGDPLPLHTDCSGDSIMLDESTADIVNSSYLMETDNADLGFNLDADPWLASLDVPDSSEISEAVGSSNNRATSDPPVSSSSEPNVSFVKVERTEGSETHVKCEIGSEECDETSVDLNKMRLLVDKDDKENARLLLPNKSEGAVNDTPSISENGDEILNNILNASEVCTIISEESARDSTVNSSCVLSSGSSEHGEVGSLISEGIAKAIIDSSRTRTNPGGNNGQTLAMKSYTFSAPTLVRGRPSNGVVKRIGNGGNAKTVVVEEV
ncbi:Enhancer of polycomb 1 [Orchesella cincta]|uniref:Enhancer of polycomb-like protein n=1 Tax=Orchesella cincta TaxID=48709 RepID=A0A1D2MNA6_ORCCI|nr:Enhancer of polycomb 1 [Orchesella cincta]